LFDLVLLGWLSLTSAYQNNVGLILIEGLWKYDKRGVREERCTYDLRHQGVSVEVEL